MKKSLMTLVTFTSLATLLVFTSCKKENTLGNGTQFRATVENCTSQNGKTVLDGVNLNWVASDQIAIYGTAGAGIYSATPQTPATVAIFDNVSGSTGDGPFRAFYPSTLTTDGVYVTLPSTQTYVEGSINEFPMYAESNDNQLAFKNLCGVLKLHLTKANTNISSIHITAGSEINGTFSVNYNSGDPDLIYSANGTNTTTLTCATPQSIAEGKDFYIYLPEGSYSGLQIVMHTNDNLYCIKTANTSINVTRSKYTLITLDGNNLLFRPVGSEGGLFSINEDGDQIWFSQGNLQYRASDGTWRFAEHQYDIVGDGNNNISATYDGWIDVFGWGTGNNPTNTSINDADYSVFVDWGTNSISNGGNEPGQWRTLSSAEWIFIINGRPNASSKRGACSINGVNGLVLLPDNWVLPTGCSFNPGYGHGWTYNTYTIAQWELMEAAGAFFFPAAGQFTYSSFGNIGTHVRYWTSTMTSTNNADRVWSNNAQDLQVGAGSSWFNHSRFSVRLVRDNN